jgi:outer membrane protein OmpA-like peptidoglycan-associated protein
MRLIKFTPIIFTILFLSVCSSNQPKVEQTTPTPPGLDLELLNKELEALEIEGFEPDKTTLIDKSYQAWLKNNFQKLVTIQEKIPDGYKIFILGHADPYGGLEKAQKVAKGRAETVFEKLKNEKSFNPSKYAIKSYGAKDYEQEKDQSVSKNRRVEFEVRKE